MSKADLSNLYYEEYDDQESGDFDFVGLDGEVPVPVTDLQSQVNEFRRLHGKDVIILVYKQKGVTC